MQAANGIRPATAQHDGTRTPRPTVPSCCAVVVRSCGLYLLRPPQAWPENRPDHFSGVITSFKRTLVCRVMVRLRRVNEVKDKVSRDWVRQLLIAKLLDNLITSFCLVSVRFSMFRDI